MIGQQKIIEFYITSLLFNRKACTCFLKPRCMLKLSHFFLKITNTMYCFLLQSFKCDSHEHLCLKTTGLYDELLYSLFHFFYFIFSAPVSLSLCLPISPNLYFCCSFSKLYQVLQKTLLLHTHTHTHTHTNTHIYIYTQYV